MNYSQQVFEKKSCLFLFDFFRLKTGVAGLPQAEGQHISNALELLMFGVAHPVTGFIVGKEENGFARSITGLQAGGKLSRYLGQSRAGR